MPSDPRIVTRQAIHALVNALDADDLEEGHEVALATMNAIWALAMTVDKRSQLVQVRPLDGDLALRKPLYYWIIQLYPQLFADNFDGARITPFVTL
eukprot:8145637-Pyramimonas_sp.AAC.1